MNEAEQRADDVKILALLQQYEEPSSEPVQAAPIEFLALRKGTLRLYVAGGGGSPVFEFQLSEPTLVRVSWDGPSVSEEGAQEFADALIEKFNAAPVVSFGGALPAGVPAPQAPAGGGPFTTAVGTNSDETT